ncbi:Holliday junction branch migration DNA helicase RuvB [Mycoplasmopsis alligatoris]|uniref:Holliday junction branch migration complex subunit RuvB n=1 Tax=Mycoplasmopsis alligatoris A21JP2 TaxID=747682 RepID=D4XW26_9BACT|nr:Holliday junction branch migration DNA helicase RuvB [Mycoplasmopsis alligatoris]EFF41441.1 Holliday junction DNA helicase RuvB [Mycoplasmopsis alligatoris A21JP2]
MKIDLRPSTFNEFIGQAKLKETIKAMIVSARVQNKSLDHILLYGPPGTGKTSLAGIIASAQKSFIHYVQASNIEKKSDLISIFSTLNQGDILFIDEVHSLNKMIEELLYNAMEDFVFDVIIGTEDNAKTMRMKIKPFTLIAATTKINNISQPLKDRFGLVGKMHNYEDSELVKILKNSASILKLDLGQSEAEYIVSFSRQTPRIANNLLKRVNDFKIAKNKEIIDLKIIQKTFDNLELYEFGLGKDHVEYIQLLKDSFDEKWASLDTISSLLNTNKENLLNDIEPILLFYRLIKKSSRGRQITNEGINYALKNL